MTRQPKDAAVKKAAVPVYRAAVGKLPQRKPSTQKERDAAQVPLRYLDL